MCGARGGSAGVVNYLAEALESLNGEATDCTGATAIHHAALAGHPSVITALSSIPGIELEAKDKVSKSQTPLPIPAISSLVECESFKKFQLLLILLYTVPSEII